MQQALPKAKLTKQAVKRCAALSSGWPLERKGLFMDSDTVQRMKPRAHRPFLPLFFSIAGWALLQAWIHLLGANYRAHILVAALGAVLTLWSVLPFPGSQHITAETNDSPPGESRWAAISGALLLLAMGAFLGSLIAKGSLLLLSVGAMTLNLVPWARLPLGRRHPFAACAASMCGFAAAILAQYRSIEVMFLPIASWVFWVCACIGSILRIEHSSRAKRGAAAKGAAMKRVAAQPHAELR